MQKKVKIIEIPFDDEITQLKPLGYNYVSFFYINLKSLVVFDPALQKIVQFFKGQDIQDYSFRDDIKYFYTTSQLIIRIYQILDDLNFLLCVSMIHSIPIGFQWNYILCAELDSSLSSNQCINKNTDSSYQLDNSYESDQDLFCDFSHIQLQIINLIRPQISNNFRIQNYGLIIMNKFYLQISGDNNKLIFQQIHYVIINNRPKIKFYLICSEIIECYQLRYSNYYLTRISQNDQISIINRKQQTFIMTKQSKNCKIIRKISLQYDGYLEQILYNHRYVLLYRCSKYQFQIQMINLWNLQIQQLNIDFFRKMVLIKNNNLLVNSEQNWLTIVELN